MIRTRMLSVIATLLVLSCAACTPVTDPQTATPTASSRPSTPSPPLTSTTPSLPRYLTGYTSDERKAYAEAVGAYEDFADEQVKILSVGKATPKAKHYYKKYSGDWLRSWNVLRQREADGIRIEGRGKTLGVRPTRINLDQSGSGSVDIRVCGVAKGVEVTQNGAPIPQPKAKPRTVKVSLFRLDGEKWWRVFMERLGPPC